MHFFIQNFIKNLIFLGFFNIFNTKVLLTTTCQPLASYKTLQSGTFYLNSERPLWILQDQKTEPESVSVQKPFKEKVKYEHLKPIYYQKRQQQPGRNYRHMKSNAQKRFTAQTLPQGLQLPRHYIPLKKNMNLKRMSTSRRYKNSKFIQNMPVFDAVPGEEAYTESRPIFVYTGNKGRMLLNTMLSEKKYPMQEPVPGQILYPPPTVVFKPKPLVEKLQQKINVTMIPFYAYEAIDPRYLTTTPTSYSSALKKHKKAKHYQAFYAPQEVFSQPLTDYSQYHYQQLEYTTNSPPTLEKPFNNHRFTTEPLTPTTPLPHKKFEVTYDDGADKFQITYEDDAPPTAAYLERPINIETSTPQYTTTSVAPITYESYKFDQNYYAFPIYTMSKLMETEQTTEASPKDLVEVSVEQQKIEALKEANDSWRDKSNEDTWFILNSRYKGPLKANTSNLHSSKYIQSTQKKLIDELKREIKTKPKTKTSTTTAKTALNREVLQPKIRSLYGENINIIL